MARLDLARIVGDPLARTMARGIVKGMARTWTIEHLRAQAARGADFVTLEQVNPRFAGTLRHMTERFPSVREITFKEVEAWVREVNEPLARQVDAEPEVRAWLRRAWDSGIRGLLAGT